MNIIETFIKFLFSKNEYVYNIDKHKFYINPRSDHLFVLNETWVKKDYKIEGNPSFDIVIDLGAHIGDFALWAVKNYKSKKVICLEPSAQLFSLLEKNIKLNNIQNKVKIYKEAIFKNNNRILLKNGLTSALNHIEDRDGLTQAITLENLFKRDKLNIVDLLKIDIEGGEQFILTEDNRDIFKEKVRYIFIEAHDLNGYKKERAVDYFKNLDYSFEVTKIKWFFGIFRIYGYNKNLISPSPSKPSSKKKLKDKEK